MGKSKKESKIMLAFARRYDSISFHDKDKATFDVLASISVSKKVLEKADHSMLWKARAYMSKDFSAEDWAAFAWKRGLADGLCSSYEQAARILGESAETIKARDYSVFNRLNNLVEAIMVANVMEGKWALRDTYAFSKTGF